MPQHDIWAAASERDTGVARIHSTTWRVGAAGVVVAGLLALAFGHHPAAGSRPAVLRPSPQASSSPAVQRPSPAASPSPAAHRSSPEGILIPAQPPQPTPASGQVTSGAS